MAVSMKEVMVELYSDPELMARFQADPKAVLQEKGAEVPEDITFQVVNDTAKVRHIVLPHLGSEKIASVAEYEERLSKSGIIGVPL